VIITVRRIYQLSDYPFKGIAELEKEDYRFLVISVEMTDREPERVTEITLMEVMLSSLPNSDILKKWIRSGHLIRFTDCDRIIDQKMSSLKSKSPNPRLD
jgi:hypothetical protein